MNKLHGVTLLERFMAKVKVRAGCWLWSGRLDPKGRAQLGHGPRAAYKNHVAARAAWFLAYGEWPTIMVCHSCDNPRCVRPSHLWLGTALDNRRDAIAKGRQKGLNPGQLALLRKLARRRMTQREAATEIGCYPETISRAVRRLGIRWRGTR